jgi:hypothetical protein
LKAARLALLHKKQIRMERVKGIEPSSQPWEGHILPLNHTRLRTELCFIKLATSWQLV